MRNLAAASISGDAVGDDGVGAHANKYLADSDEVSSGHHLPEAVVAAKKKDIDVATLRSEGHDRAPKSEALPLELNDSDRHPLPAVVHGRLQDLKSEFDDLLRPYTENSGMTADDIDEDFAEATERMARLHKKGRHNKALQRKIDDFERLMELRLRISVESTSEDDSGTR